MSPAIILGLVGGLLVFAFVANRIYGTTHIPDVVVLMALGVLIGPVLGLVDTQAFSKATNLLGTLAIILVLFEGGLELDLRNTLRHFPGSLLLAFLAYIFSVALVALIIVKGLGLSISSGLLVGAALGCTSSAVVLPVLQQMKSKEAVRVTLMLEASWGDVLAVLTVGLLLGLRDGGGAIAINLAHGFLTQVGIALIFSIAAGILWARLLPVLSEQRFWQVLTFSVVLVLFAGMEALHANGLIAVLGFGLTLSNFHGLDPRHGLKLTTLVTESQQALLTFHSELAFLMRTFFFMLIGAVAQLESFRHYPLLMAGTVAALFVARWLAVHSSRWAWREIGEDDREAILWMLPRGLITIVLAIQIAGVHGTGVPFLPGLAFAVILVTNLMVVFGSLRVRAPEPEPAEEEVPETGYLFQPSELEPEPAPTATTRRRRKWITEAALLGLLVVAGWVLWYSNLPPDLRPGGIREWFNVHMAR
jgi:Na+:H+ antiporter